MHGYPHALPNGDLGAMTQVGVEEIHQDKHTVTSDPINEDHKFEEEHMTKEESLELLRRLYQEGHIDIWTFWSWADAFGL